MLAIGNIDGVDIVRASDDNDVDLDKDRNRDRDEKEIERQAWI